MLHGLGVETGVDLARVVQTGQWICEVLGRESTSKAGRALLAEAARARSA
jgi:hydroxymethylglutaryl-CoA lyase